MNQSSRSTATCAEIPTPAPNSCSEMPGTSLEEQFLSLIEDALGRLGLEREQVEVHVREVPGQGLPLLQVSIERRAA